MWFLITLSRGYKFEILFKKWGDKLEISVEEAIKDKLNIDNEDIVLNNLTICNYQWFI